MIIIYLEAKLKLAIPVKPLTQKNIQSTVLQNSLLITLNNVLYCIKVQEILICQCLRDQDSATVISTDYTSMYYTVYYRYLLLIVTG